MSDRGLRWLTQPPVFRGIILCLTMMMASTATAGVSEGEAGQADEFLRYGASVRSLGMGRAYVALADDASALYYNPAGLMRLRRGLSVYGMHFKPFYESDYNFVSFAVSRPDPNATGIKNFFFGSGSAWGASFVHLGSDGYEQRDDEDNLVDENFELYQYAFMLAFAREYAGSAGILGYGATFKIVRHGVSNATGEYNNSDGSFGLDIGVQWQMINPPLLKELTRVPLVGTFFQLKHLMPLRLGLSIRNVVSPKLGYGGESDKYPTALRFGASYHLSSNWLLQNSRITLVSDFEWLYDDMDRLIRLDRRVVIHKVGPGDAQYFGTEFQYRTAKMQLSPRFGWSHVYDELRFSAGLGLAFETSGLDFQFDFAHGFHEELVDDQRISLTIRFGGKRDASYFAGDELISTSVSPDPRWSKDPCLPIDATQSVDTVMSTDTVISSTAGLPPLNSILHVLSGYPDQWREAVPAAILLAWELDTLNADRYLELVGGPSLAVNLAENAIVAFQAGKHVEARGFALEAIDEFKEVADTSQNIMDNNYFNVLLGQCEMINAATDNGAAADGAWSRAERILYRSLSVIQCLRLHFLVGTCHQKQRDFAKAAEQFQLAIEASDDDSQSMRKLARLLLGDALMNGGRPDSAIAVLTFITDDHTLQEGEVDADYPRYWTFSDMQITDDAQYLKGQCYLKKNDAMTAAAEFVKVCRFYSGSDKCSDANNEADKLIQRLLEKTR